MRGYYTHGGYYGLVSGKYMLFASEFGLLRLHERRERINAFRRGILSAGRECT